MILAIVALGVFLIGKWDEPLPLRGKSWPWIFAGAAAEFVSIMVIAGDSPVREKLLWAVIGGSLLLACVMDGLLCQVYDFSVSGTGAFVVPLQGAHGERLAIF